MHKLVFFKKRSVFMVILQYWWLLAILIAIVIIVIYYYFQKKEIQKDAITDYGEQHLGGRFHEFENGETWLVFPYEKTQQKKKQYILNNTFQDMEMADEYGYTYLISKLISAEYYHIIRDRYNKVKSKTGPYVTYKVIPKTEMKQSNINIDRTTGPVQVNAGNSTGYQHTENSNFLSGVNEYRDLMINNGILEEDINAVLSHPDDHDVKQSFLSKYGVELAKITVNVAGTIVSLLSLLKS